jgi:hypothetical protein
MTVTHTREAAMVRHHPSRQPWLAAGLIALGFALGVNTLLGPLFLGLVEYPFTETVINETLGLEAVSLALVAPLAMVAGVLAWRGHRAGAVLGLGPAAYAAYMLVQYVVGPQYPTYQPSVALHLALFTLSLVVLVRSAQVASSTELPRRSSRWGIVALLMGAFVVVKWLPAFAGMTTNEPIPAASPDVTMYWSIFLLDLGIVVPVTVATGLALLLGARWAQTALYAVVGWFAMVPPSVAAMSIVKLLRDDPNAVAADAIQFAVVAVVFAGIAIALFWQLFSPEERPGSMVLGERPSSSAPIASGS